MGTSLNVIGGGGSVTEEVTQNITNVTNYYEEVNEATGFTDPDSFILAFDDETREFSITPDGDSFVFYAFGTRYEKTEAEEKVITDTTGQWYFYYDADGVLGATQALWDLATQVPVASVYWDGGAGTIDSEPKTSKNVSSDIYIIGVSIPGTLTDSQVVLFHAVVGGETIELPKKLFYSQIVCETAPTSDATFTIYVNAVSKGSATITAGQTTGTFTFNSKVSLNAGDKIKIIAPSSADATLENVAITIRADRL